MYVTFKIFHNYFNRVLFYSFWKKKRIARTAIYLEIFQNVPLRVVGSIFFVFGLLT